MGLIESTPQPITFKLKKHDNLTLKVPYSKLEMIRVLQQHFQYEVKGTLHFEQGEFTSFEISTDNSETSSSGPEHWKLSFHTHPDKTAQKYGYRYYSPPSPEDVLEVYQLSQNFVPESISKKLGEISLVIANEGIYLQQVDRMAFKRLNLHQQSDEELEDYLMKHYNEFLVATLKEGLPGSGDYEDPDIDYDDLTRILKRMAKGVSDKFGLLMKFYSWNELKEKGHLQIASNSYFATAHK